LSEHARKRARAVLRGRDDGNIILLPDRNFIGWYRHITLVLVAAAYPDREYALPTAAVLKLLSPCLTLLCLR